MNKNSTTTQAQNAIQLNVQTQHLQPAQVMNIALRRGVCRTMNQHLLTLSTADIGKDPQSATQAKQAIGLLAHEMMNYYIIPNDELSAAEQQQTQASNDIWQNTQDFQQQRQNLTQLLKQEVTIENQAQLSQNIKQACQSCHQHYIRS